MVDARLPDGSRVNAIIRPLALHGPVLTIRKFSRQRFSMDRLVETGALTRQMANFLKICVTHRKNILVSGGTGSVTAGTFAGPAAAVSPAEGASSAATVSSATKRATAPSMWCLPARMICTAEVG